MNTEIGKLYKVLRSNEYVFSEKGERYNALDGNPIGYLYIDDNFMIIDCMLMNQASYKVKILWQEKNNICKIGWIWMNINNDSEYEELT